MSWCLVVIFSLIIMLSFRVGIILSACSCLNTLCPVRPRLQLPQQPLWNKEAQPKGELLSLERDVYDSSPHRVTHPISLFPLIIEGNWVVIPG